MAAKSLLTTYSVAGRALAAMVDPKRITKFLHEAMAVEEYARLAKDPELVADAAEFRKRAERRLGEVLHDLPKAKPPGGSKARPRKKDRVASGPDHPKPLTAYGIDKHLADRARKARGMSPDRFEVLIAKIRKIAVASVEDVTAVIRQARVERHQDRKKHRAKRESELAAKIIALPTKKYGVILADPEWRFEFWSELGKTNSSADNHYITSELEKIKQRDVASIAADDCVLFLWGTVPMLPQALEVLAAWGFTYKSNFSWVKDKAGTGYWNRNKHEHLLVGTRGKIPAPAEGDQWDSAIEAAVGEHSAKPERFYELIEAYFPTLPKIELNARSARTGWDSWGNEAVQQAAE